MTTTLGRLFYGTVLGVALIGAGTAAAGWLDWWPPFAFLAVAAVELGGVYLSMEADDRRRLGERATVARLLSAAVAAGAVVVQVLGHEHEGQAAFFAGMSLLGYAVYLVRSAARRRDQMRADGKLPPTPPAYGLVQWLRHPWLTRRARHLARETPKLGLYGSLAAAADAFRTERRQRAIAKLLRRQLRAQLDPARADVALAVYDMEEIARRLVARADYDGLTAVLAVDVLPAAAAPPAPDGADEPVDRRRTDMTYRRSLDCICPGLTDLADCPRHGQLALPSAGSATETRPADEPADLAVARTVAAELAAAGQRITRDNLAAAMRGRGSTVANGRASELVRLVKTAPIQ